jgi:hypothetical protein
MSTIAEIKEASQTYQPLVLVEFTFADGSIERFCTHSLTEAGGNFQYSGNDYQGRVIAHNIQPIGASQQGFSMPPSASITLADDDRWVYQNCEMAKGFGGAQMLLRFIAWDAGTDTYSSDCYFPFVGTCSQPSGSDTDLQVSAVSLINMTGTKFPPLVVQRLCPNQFPATAAQRQDGADNIDSWYYPCGYSPDAAGGNACGNCESGTTPFTSCGYTKADCVARGMYTADSASRQTGRFGGFQWDPATYVRSESYTEDSWSDIFSDPNTAKYGQPVPMVYGAQWVKGLVIHTEGDANSTRAEVLLCSGRVSGIAQLICNGETVPAANTVDGETYNVADELFRYNVVNSGRRSGAPCADAGFDAKGDPFGSMCVVEVVVPRSLVASPSSPDVQALIYGPILVQFAAISQVVVSGGVATAAIATDIADGTFNSGFDVTIIGNACAGLNATWHIAGTGWNSRMLTWTATGVADGTYAGGFVRYRGYTASPVWVLYDLLTYGGFDYTTVDLSTFAAVDAYCAQAVSYKKSDGSTGSHPRFRVGWAITQQRSLGEAVRDALASFGGMLCHSPTTGLLELHIKRTLAEQQPSPVEGSNYSRPITSVHADGTAGTGYAAYLFDVGSILRENKKAQISLVPRQNSDLQNSYSISFQDAENQYVADTYEVTDSDAVARMGQLLNATMPGIPPTTYDQAQRAANQMLGENLRCNARLDPSGSTRVEIETTFKAVHLRQGHIVLLTWERLGIEGQMFRVMSVQPTTNWETAKIVLQWHEDIVWTDAYGQGNIPESRAANAGKTSGLPYPPLISRGWIGYPGVDALRPDEHGMYGIWSDASWATSTSRAARFWCFPAINSFSPIARPKTLITGTSLSTGGAFAGGKSYWVWISAEDADGMLTSPVMARVDVPSGTTTNSLTVPSIVWDADSVAYHVWVSDTPARPYYYGRSVGAPANITLTAGLQSTLSTQLPLPDPSVAGMRIKLKRVLIPGAWEGAITSATSSSISCSGAGWAANRWAGRIVTMVGRANPATRVDNPPMNSWTIASNTADTLTLAAGGANPTAFFDGAYTDCYVVIRCATTSASANTIEDSSLALGANSQRLRLVRIIKGTGIGQTASIDANTATVLTVSPAWATVPDETSVFWIEEPAWISKTDYALKNAHWSYTFDSESAQYSIDITGLAKTHLLMQPLGIDANGRETTEALAYPSISDMYFSLDAITDTVELAIDALDFLVN